MEPDFRRVCTPLWTAPFYSLSERERGNEVTPKIIQAVVAYWTDMKTNVFRNCPDALFGIVPLILLPLASLIPALLEVEAGFWSYTFPLSCISIAGMYDAYGRMEKEAPKNVKLGIRIALNRIALLLSAILLNYGRCVRWIPGVILIICGSMLLREICQRVSTSILMSEWFPG